MLVLEGQPLAITILKREPEICHHNGYFSGSLKDVMKARIMEHTGKGLTRTCGIVSFNSSPFLPTPQSTHLCPPVFSFLSFPSHTKTMSPHIKLWPSCACIHHRAKLDGKLDGKEGISPCIPVPTLFHFSFPGNSHILLFPCLLPSHQFTFYLHSILVCFIYALPFSTM